MLFHLGFLAWSAGVTQTQIWFLPGFHKVHLPVFPFCSYNSLFVLIVWGFVITLFLTISPLFQMIPSNSQSISRKIFHVNHVSWYPFYMISSFWFWLFVLLLSKFPYQYNQKHYNIMPTYSFVHLLQLFSVPMSLGFLDSLLPLVQSQVCFSWLKNKENRTIVLENITLLRSKQ